MTYIEVSDMIRSFDFPYNYYQFPKGAAVPPPFVVFYFPESADFIADNKNYSGIRQLVIELYTDNKDFQAEATIEETLEANEIPYTKTEIYIEDEQLFEVAYEMEVLING